MFGLILNMICERLNDKKLLRLSQHKYSASGTTLLDPLMQRYWRWFVERVVPLWWSPNAMTLVGLACNIVTACILVYYSPDAKQPIPAWPLLLCAVGLFMYQTLDACDGKQARRTKTSSSLGELFDHGCDSVSTIFVSLSVCLAVQLGECVALMLILQVMATALFYMAHWQTYVTGELKFAKFDVTEAQMTIIVIQVVSAICGTSFWTYERIDSLGVDLRLAVMLMTAFSSVVIGCRYFNAIITKGVGKNGSSVAIPWLMHVKLQMIPTFFSIGNELLIFCTEAKVILSGGVGKNGSTVADTSILSPLIPIFLSVVSALTIFFKSPTPVFSEHICLYLITFGLVTAKITNKLVVAQMSKSEITKLDSVFIGPLLLFLNQYFNTIIDEYVLLWIALVYILLDFLYYSYSTCSQIADYLKIRVLSIQYQRPPSTHSSQSSVRNNGSDNSTNAEHWSPKDWKQYAIPFWDQIPDFLNHWPIKANTQSHCLQFMIRQKSGNSSDHYEINYSRDHIIECSHGWHYTDHKISIISQLQLVCDRKWILEILPLISSVGFTLSVIVLYFESYCFINNTTLFLSMRFLSALFFGANFYTAVVLISKLKAIAENRFYEILFLCGLMGSLFAKGINLLIIYWFKDWKVVHILTTFSIIPLIFLGTTVIMGPDGCTGNYCPIVDSVNAITLIDGINNGINNSNKCVQQLNGSLNNKCGEESVNNSVNIKTNRQTNGQTVKQPIRKCNGKEVPPLYLELLCYLSYAVLILFGYLRDFLRRLGLEKTRSAVEVNREGYVPLYQSFESFFTRNIYRRVCDGCNRPITCVPGAVIDVMDRLTDDYNWTFKYPGTTTRAINMGSYNYLGFAENSGTNVDIVDNIIHKYGVGVGATRQECGTIDIQKELERRLAQFLGVESSIVFGMGFATNSTNIPTLAEKGSLIISDEYNHASLILGCRKSGASIAVFKHNDMKDLEMKIRQHIISGQERTHRPWKKIIIIVEGIYSMEGTIINLPEIVKLKRKYRCYVYLDEAHSIGAIGRRGRGVSDYFGCDPKDIDLWMGTFTKSFGAAGGYIAGRKQTIDYIAIHSQAATYATSIAPCIVQQIISVINVIMGVDGTDDGQKRIERLSRNARYFRSRLKQMGFVVYGNDDSPVVPIMICFCSKISAVVRTAFQCGIGTVGAAFPATPLTTGRVRFCVSASHTKEMLDKALTVMDEIGDQVAIKYSKQPKSCEKIIY
ncbi:unnamed protein product [Medioppia subpectinata]|uniref:Aminotransferase class I/classII large domain-containing protein n=1 Tax=Medioppia subpectinata TaxID=1979941 RepID=A0A7R9KCR6_9ACAR|nr:unnamed protein product [Medioppia subpectinata]CAG2100234.1 unnamed protein product [Medioppia subpectinata]